MYSIYQLIFYLSINILGIEKSSCYNEIYNFILKVQFHMANELMYMYYRQKIN